MPRAKRSIFARGGTGQRGRTINAMITNYRAWSQLMQEDLRDALDAVGREIIDSTTPLVPVEYGSLRDSGKYEVQETNRGPRLEVGYGGKTQTPSPNTKGTDEVDYAVYVHEDLSLNHNVGQAKFLEEGVQQTDIEGIIAKHVRSN